MSQEFTTANPTQEVSADTKIPIGVEPLPGTGDLPKDPLFGYQWHLLNTGQFGAKAGVDLNVAPVWQDYTGKGVKVGVLEGSGIEYTHPDIAANYDINIDYNTISGNGIVYPDSNHATSVAGIIAAVANNSRGGVGVAYDATIASYQFAYEILPTLQQDLVRTNEQTAILLEQARLNEMDVINNSWGFLFTPFEGDFSNPLLRDFAKGIEELANLGRDGLGTIIVNAAGNERGENTGYWANGSNFTNSPYTIAVGAVNSNGEYSAYSSQGANLLVSAPSDNIADNFAPSTLAIDPADTLSVVTTDRTNIEGPNWEGTTNDLSADYTNIFGGTSSASPMVSAIVALMLEANPNLGYRDVQEILAYTARRDVLVNPKDTDQQWADNGANNWNGGGLHYNIDYGFGLVDATAAVRLAETWQLQSVFSNEKQFSTIPLNLPTPVVVEGDRIISQEIVIDEPIQIDHVEINLNLEHENTGDLVVTLVSPNGTRSILINGSNGDGEGTPYQGNDFKLSSTAFWGESAVGTWRLEIDDRNPTANNGIFSGSTLTLRGDTISDDDTYLYTNEFGLLPDDLARRVLDDSSGIDTINAATVTSNSIINLAPTLGDERIENSSIANLIGSENSTIAGQTLQITAETVIENVFTGDGDDRIYGNFVNNQLNGGRGDDTLSGIAGNNQLWGGAGNDRLFGSVSLILDFLLNGNFSNSIEDSLVGNDFLDGGDGDDFLSGGEGSDFLDGGAGEDVLFGELNNFNIAEVSGFFSSTNDLLFGGAGNDQLFGQTGNDTLSGGAGNDELRGGDGADKFTFSNMEGIDTITDFIWEQGDKIVVSAGEFGGGLVEGNIERNLFHIGSAADDVFDRFIYDSSGGELFYDVDGSGAIEQQQFAQLSPGSSLTYNDIEIIA